MSEELKLNENVSAPQPDALARIARKDDFLQQLQEFLAQHKGENWCVAAIDLEHFKLYTELYGAPQARNLMLSLAALLLEHSKVTGSPVGYFGSDDFVLCLPDDKEQQLAIISQLQTCVNSHRQDVTSFLSLGVCPVAEHPDADAQTLCSYAQIASVDPCPAVGGVHRFTPTMLSRIKEQRQLLSELEHGLKNHEFCFFLQPKCNSMTRAIVGMEALVRWNHPTRGIVSPGEFVPLMEETGLITRLDLYLWEEVCQMLHGWKARNENMVPISVNVSISDIAALDVAQVLWELVQKYQLEPKLLLVEITESMLAQNLKMVENTIAALHRKGFAVLMDDFGSGYSSLNVLRNTSVDAIKLDMQFIVRDSESSKGKQIVESVIEMARRLNLPIIAEGVETQEQVFMLQSMDCLYTQGYYFYKPMAVKQAEELLAQPAMENYWDLRRDMTRRNYKAFTGGLVSEKSAITLQAFQILADNALLLARLDLVTGEYRIVKRDERLMGVPEEKTLQLESYCEQLVAEKAIHPEDAAQFRAQAKLELLQAALFRERRSVIRRCRRMVAGEYVWVRIEVLPCKDCSPEDPWAVVVAREEFPEE